MGSPDLSLLFLFSWTHKTCQIKWINVYDFISIMYYYWVRVEILGLVLEPNVRHLSLLSTLLTNFSIDPVYYTTGDCVLLDSEKVTYVDVTVDSLIKMSKWQIPRQKSKREPDKRKKKRKKQNPTTSRIINDWCTVFLGKRLYSRFKFILTSSLV